MSASSTDTSQSPDHCDKAILQWNQSHTILVSQYIQKLYLHYTVTYQVFKKSAKHLKNNVDIFFFFGDIFIKNILLLKHANHHLSLQWVKIVTSKITDYRPPQRSVTICKIMYNNNFKIWDTVRITKMWLKDMKWANAVGKMDSVDLFDTGLSETFNLLKKKKKKRNISKAQ